MHESIDDREWLNMSLKEYLKKHLFPPKDPKKHGIDEAADIIKGLELPEDYKRIAEKNSEQMDKHMIWISGGATVLIVSIFSSERFLDICYTNWLIPSLIGFGLCLLFVIASYRSEAHVLGAMPTVQETVNKLLKYMNSVKAEDDQEIAWKKAERIWKKMRSSIKWGFRFITITQWANNLALLSFLIGMLSFVIFGTMSIISSPNCMTLDKRGGSEEKSFSTQTSTPMFQQLVSSIPTGINSSGSGIETSPMLQSSASNAITSEQTNDTK